MAFVRYDRYSANKREAQIHACYSMGVVGEILPDTINRAKVQHVQALIALQTSNVVFSDGKPDKGPRKEIADKMEQEFADRIDQERKWIEHYNACQKAYQDGKKKKLLCLKAFQENSGRKGLDLSDFCLPVLLSLANVFDANSNSSLASGLTAGELKGESKPPAAKVEQETVKQPENKSEAKDGKKVSGSDTIVGPDRKMTRAMYEEKRRQERIASGRNY